MTTFSPKDIQIWDLERLTANPKNARKHSPEQIQEIAASMTEFGFMSAVVVDSAGVILAGNARVDAARAIGLKSVPVILADHLTDTQKKAFAIADNQIALHATWENEILKVQLDLLRQEGVDLKLVGFSNAEFNRLADELEAQIRLDDEDAAPELPEIPITVPGDIWQMGEHLLLCGDATVDSAYDTLLGGVLTDMAFVDSPYNVGYKAPLATDGSVRHEQIPNDDLGTGFESFLSAVCRNIIARINGAIYMCMASSELHTLYKAFTEVGGYWSTFIIWAKQNFTLGHSDYQRGYEPLLFGWPKGKQHYWCGKRDQSDLWQIDRVHRCDLHPTMKPVELVERAICNSSKRGDLVLDPFCGSGTTVIACEKTERRARVIELEPRYCDVIVKRWQDFTSKVAIHQVIGKTFAEIGESRLAIPDSV